MAALLWLLTGYNSAIGQLFFDPVSTAMGNSTLVSTGYRAIYTNPANLLTESGPGKWQIGFGELGGLHNHTGISFKGDRRSYIEESFMPFHLEMPELTEADRGQLLNQWFSAGRDRFDKISSASMLLFGLSYAGDDVAFGLAARARAYSTMSIGKGWYDAGTGASNTNGEINRNLRQQAGAWIEVSMGMARDLDFFTDMTAENNRLILGLAPKLIVAGPHIDLTYSANYSSKGSGQLAGLHSYDIRSSGFFNGPIKDYFVSRQSDFNIQIPDDTSLLSETTGYGFGTDFSLTYDIRLGSSSGYTGEGNRLKLSVAMTDLGFIVYGGDVYTRRTDADSISFGGASPTIYEPTGRLGDWFFLIEQQDGDRLVFDETAKVSNASIAYGLPSAIHGGLSLRYGKLLTIVQASSGLNLQAGNTRQVRLSMGTEFRGLPWLPIRAGVLTDGLGGAEMTLGAGLDARYYELAVGARYRPANDYHGWLPTAAGMAALQIRF
jgi:hypothetical protein